MIRMTRRQAIAGLAGTALAGTLGMSSGAAADFPSRPITLVVPFAAGGSADLVGRILATNLEGRIGQPVVVENQPGAGGAVGAQQVAKAVPDGYTLLLGTISSHAINADVYSDLPYDPVADFTPIAQFGTVPYVLVVNSSLGVTTLAEFIKYAHDKGNLPFGSAGIGTANHLAGALLSSREGLNAVHVPYRGGSQAITALLHGEIAFMFYPYLALLPHIKEGTLRALAITSKERITALPDLPTMAEAGEDDFVISGFFAVYAPAGAPKDVVATLETGINAVIADEAVKKKLIELGVDPIGSSSAELSALMKSEIERWKPVVEAAGAKQ